MCQILVGAHRSFMVCMGFRCDWIAIECNECVWGSIAVVFVCFLQCLRTWSIGWPLIASECIVMRLRSGASCARHVHIETRYSRYRLVQWMLDSPNSSSHRNRLRLVKWLSDNLDNPNNWQRKMRNRREPNDSKRLFVDKKKKMMQWCESTNAQHNVPKHSISPDIRSAPNYVDW